MSTTFVAISFPLVEELVTLLAWIVILANPFPDLSSSVGRDATLLHCRLEEAGVSKDDSEGRRTNTIGEESPYVVDKGLYYMYVLCRNQTFATTPLDFRLVDSVFTG